MTKIEILEKADLYNKETKIFHRYVGQLFTLYRLKKLKEEIDHNRSISSR